MRQRCEVCESFRPEAELGPSQKLLEVAFGTRRVLLCVGHVRIAQNSGVNSFKELRELYGAGRRSFVSRRSRRSTLEPDDKRQSVGRRASDPRS